MRIIGIDGGASKVSGGIVEKINLNTFKLVEPAIDIKYIEHPNYNTDFLPLPLYLQSENRISPNEKNQGSVFIDCVLEVIQSLADSNPIQVAIAMPGIKSDRKKCMKSVKFKLLYRFDFCNQIQAVIQRKHKAFFTFSTFSFIGK